MRKRKLCYLFWAVSLIIVIQFAGIKALAESETATIELKESSITLIPPFEITETMLYKDGGTIGIVVKDSQGISLPLCYDRRIKVPEEERFVYVGATYPDESSSKKVVNGSETEKALLKVLTSAENTGLSPNIRKDLVQTVIRKLGGKSRFLMWK